ncbi:MAG: VWA domain-containing protein [Bryobacteraceae bacterium]
MRQLNKTIFPGIVLALAFATGAKAQDATFRADTRLVVLHASVFDKNGKLVTNLGRDVFRVQENGVDQELKIFRREDVPVSLGLVIDNSGSMRDRRQRVEAAALALVKASNRDDEVLIVNFNDEAYEDVPFTNDIKKMQEGLTRIDSRGGTAMWDAVNMTMDHMKQKGKRDKKVILLITDGNDNMSSTSLERLVQKAHTSDIVIHAIGLLAEEERREARKAKRGLDALTQASGGMAFYPKALSEVEEVALQIAHDIRNQYILAYSPTEQALDGSFRQVKVTIQGNSRLTVRTRSGYYATPDTGGKTTLSRSEAGSGT